MRFVLLTVIACSAPTRPPVAPVPTPPVAARTTEPSLPTEPSWTPPPEPAPEPPLPVTTTPERCSIRVSDRGITVDGDAMARTSAVARCKRRSAALVELADGANQAEWDQLHAALVSAGITILMRGAPGNDVCHNALATGCVRVPANPRGCADNPLAKGCM